MRWRAGRHVPGATKPSGRPKDPDTPKYHQVGLRVLESEYRVLLAYSVRHHVSMSSLFREFVRWLEEKEKEKP